MKRTELKRKTPMKQTSQLRARGPAKASAPVKGKCRHCKAVFERRNSMHVACSPDCAIALAEAKRKRDEAQDAARDRKEIRARREALKTLNDHIAELQVIFNRYIRARDLKAGHGCIDCGKPFEPNKIGGSVDAGHYLSRGAAPHLRFDERNVHAQRKNCNRPGGTTREAFRAGMVERIGLGALEALEADQESRNWTIPDIVEMKALYRGKLKELKNG